MQFCIIIFHLKWKIRGVRFGWGTLLIALYFILTHTLQYDPDQLGLYWSYGWTDVAALVTASITFGVMREVTGSLWPCMVLHSLFNVGIPLTLVLIH